MNNVAFQLNQQVKLEDVFNQRMPESVTQNLFNTMKYYGKQCYSI